MGKKLSLSKKKDVRTEERAKVPSRAKAGGDRIDKIINEVNKTLAGGGFIFRGSEIERQDISRRSSGIPSIDYVLNGGFPKGGLVQIGGEYSTGKTTICLHSCAYIQRQTGEAVAWVALEPFSKQWARENGFFIPFNEETGDPFEGATELEKLRMAEVGIEDPYTEVSPFVLVQEERGDTALHAALKLLQSNEFAMIVVDSLGVARSTKWLEENEVEDFSDFPREPRMINDYTTRAVLTLNKRYDENNQPAKDGPNRNQTTLVHLNHVGIDIGTQARTPYKKYRIKGGEGNKHNHHAMVFLWKGSQLRFDKPGMPAYVYGQETNVICIKSKIGPPFREGTFDFYFQPYGAFQSGDIDAVKDGVGLAIRADVVVRSGAWYEFEGHKHQGREAFEAAISQEPEVFWRLMEQTQAILKR